MAKVLAISWSLFSNRLAELSEEVGAERINISVMYGRAYLAPFRYLAMLYCTLIVLVRENPDAVYAQNPPIFCPLVCLLYCRLKGRRLVIDHHCVWSIKTVHSRAIDWLEKFASRSAYANTAPHEGWGDVLRARGAARVLVVHDFVEGSGRGRPRPHEGFLVIASHGGHPLEAIEEEMDGVIEGGGKIVVTGPPEKLASRLSNLRGGAQYLGYLPREEYEGLKRQCDMAVNITEEPYTVSHALYEYMACGLPVLTRRKPYLQTVFGDALIYSQGSISAQVALLKEDPGALEGYRDRIEGRQRLLREWRSKESRALYELLWR